MTLKWLPGFLVFGLGSGGDVPETGNSDRAYSVELCSFPQRPDNGGKLRRRDLRCRKILTATPTEENTNLRNSIDRPILKLEELEAATPCH